MANVLLVSGAVSGKKRYGALEKVGAYLPPYGLLSVAAVLERAGHRVVLVDREISTLDDVQIVDLVHRERIDVVGLSVFTIGSEEGVKLAAAIKAACDVPILAGGPHVFVGSKLLMRHHCFDYLVVGEGEITATELVDALARGDDVEAIPGLLIRRGDDWLNTPQRMQIQELDDLPFPAFHLLSDISKYHPTPFGYRRLPHMPIVTSRGCPFHCVFCSAIWGHHWRAHSAEYVLGLLDLLVKRYGIREVWFTEDTFAINRQRVVDICEGILRAGYDLAWSCMTNVHVLDEELVRLMRRAGCWQVQVGLESGSDEVLSFIRKPIRTAMIREKVNMMHRHGIKVRGYFILGHLVDTRETMRQTVQFAMSLPLHTAEFHILHLPLGSEARQIAHEYGQVNPDLSLLTGYTESGLSFVPKGLTVEEMFAIRRSAHNQFFLRPQQIWRLLSDIKSLSDLKRYFTIGQVFVKTLARSAI